MLGPVPNRSLCNSLNSAILSGVASQLQKLTGDAHKLLCRRLTLIDLNLRNELHKSEYGSSSDYGQLKLRNGGRSWRH